MRATVLVPILAAAIGPAESAAVNDTITAVPGIRVGHYTLTERPTGCTVILADLGAIAGVAQRGAAPGTRETDLLQPANGGGRVNGIVLSGGSAFGLDSANGAVRWLEERGAADRRVPIVPTAVLIDLWVGGKPSVRPGADCGYRAAASASRGAVVQGSVGAGAGATVGKLLGRDRAMKGGIGSAAIVQRNGLRVAAIVAVNALGDVIDPATGAVIAGARAGDGSFADARRLLRSGAPTILSSPQADDPAGNTTIAVVATNARLTGAEASRVAQIADGGFARAIAPIHTLGDGDTVFALATGAWRGAADAAAIGALAADAVAAAIVRAVKRATTAGGVPAARDLPQ